MRCLLLVCLVAVMGCGNDGKPVTDQQAIDALKAQAAEVGKATINNEHGKVADLTHPALVQKFGGREKMITTIEGIAQQMKEQGLKIRELKLEDPSGIVESGGELFATIPFRLEMETPKGVLKQRSALIGVSTDGGKKWQFIDTSGLKGGKTMIKELLPKLPDNLALPEPSQPELVKE